jgi:hypothetical protein
VKITDQPMGTIVLLYVLSAKSSRTPAHELSKIDKYSFGVAADFCKSTAEKSFRHINRPLIGAGGGGPRSPQRGYLWAAVGEALRVTRGFEEPAFVSLSAEVVGP